MHMTGLDWIIVAVCVGALSWFSLKAVRYTQGVADFLSANRSAGRYMLMLARGMSGAGAISVLAGCEQYYEAAFPTVWWSWMIIPAMVVVSITGWVYYRFRETRCLTLAQFFEVRYSRNFRVFAGLMIWISGIANFGIFPYVAGNFFVYFCGFPEKFMLLNMSIPTYWPIMLLTLGMALTYTCLGGQITVMLTDCVQGIFCGIAFLVLCLFLLNQYAWPEITTALQDAPARRVRMQAQEDFAKARTAYEEALRDGSTDIAEKKTALDEALAAQDEEAIQAASAGKSMLNPFKTGRVKDFSIWFFLIMTFNIFYGAMSWQGSQAYQSSGISPHEQKMGGIIDLWRMMLYVATVLILAICALTFLTHPQYAMEASTANSMLQTLKSGDAPQLATQQRVPIAMAFMLPAGLRGLFCVVMIFLLVTTQDTYLHSWGSVFIQDVVMPLRKRAFGPKQHIRWLRWSIGGVALFAFVFGCFYKPNEYILMYMAITGSIISGLGATIICGLYWKRGSTSAAWTAVGLGAVTSLSFLGIRQFADGIKAALGDGFLARSVDYINSWNSMFQWFFISLACMASYVILSLIFGKPFNMDRMLHRGKYDTKQEHVKAKDATTSGWLKRLGITDEFTRTDRILAFALVIWNAAWVILFTVATIWNFTVGEISTAWWAGFWHVWVWMQIGVGIPTTIWFTVGGIRDIRRVFHRLATLKRDDRDDGRVIDHHLADEENENGRKGPVIDS